MTEADARLYPETVDLACVLVRDQTYALDVTAVREIVRFAPLTPLPDAPALIEGVLDLRGTVLPVVDLARVLARGRSDGGLRARIVVLEVDRLVLGLWVDAATDVLSVERAALEPLPSLATETGGGCVGHVVRRPKQPPVLVLDPTALVEAVRRSGSQRSPAPEVAA